MSCLFVEEANFNWPTFLLGNDYQQPIISNDYQDVKECLKKKTNLHISFRMKASPMMTIELILLLFKMRQSLKSNWNLSQSMMSNSRISKTI